MKAVIFCGGVGSRFWPVSTSSSPKQFAPTLGDKSFIELTVKRLLQLVSASDIYISTGLRFKNEVMALLPQVPQENFIFEPEMKDTAMAVAYSTKVLGEKFPKEPFGIFWSDHMVRDIDTFRRGFEACGKKVLETGKMVYFEVPIRFPDVNRGYVELGKKIESLDDKSSFFEFKKFLEKPSLKKAEYYYKHKERFACNTGYLVSTPETLLSKFKKYAPDIFSLTQVPIKEAFSAAPKMSFDYAVAEHLTSQEVIVLRSDFGYYDMGEWITIKQAMEESPGDNVALAGLSEFFDTKDSLAYGQRGKLIALVGLEGVGVIDTKDALLVLNLKDSDKVKQLVAKLKESGREKYV